MSKFQAGLGGNAGKIATAAVVVALLALGVWMGNKRNPAIVTTPTALVQPQADAGLGDANTPAKTDVMRADETAPKTDTDATTDSALNGRQAGADSSAAPDTPNTIAAPAFDEVRREADGMTVVAGRAAPGATVQLLRDGAVIATTTADGSGKFATLAMIAPDGQGHVLSLSQRVAGADLPSQDEIILAPTQAPVVTAEVSPAASADVDTITPVPTGTSEPETAVAEASEPSTPAPETNPSMTSADVAVLKSTQEGVELLNAARPEVMATVALDTISYSDEGDVQLAGRAQPATQTVRVYLDNEVVINLPVDDQGRWRGNIPDVDEGIYILRVDEVGPDGNVTSRVETPFRRESAEALAKASAAQEGPIKAITVQAGATLWAIARERYGDGRLYVRVFNANQSDIRDPDLIYPGQVFDLPD
tara:strand:+ start:519 stop:1781 length:1263 start_codon:yes stop_codon:yes gene_type:complete